MQNLNIKDETSFMCSFDISSLFTNVPLNETIKICADALYRSELNSPPFPEEVFIELMETATHSVEFSFNNEMYQKKDGVAMGSPLGLALANIFVGFHEEHLFDCDQKPGVYFRKPTSVYRKPTFSGLYTRWSSFCPKQRKISLIKTLTHRALMICSKSKLNSELEKLTKIFLEKGYPEDVISVYIKEKIGNFSKVPGLYKTTLDR